MQETKNEYLLSKMNSSKLVEWIYKLEQTQQFQAVTKKMTTLIMNICSNVWIKSKCLCSCKKQKANKCDYYWKGFKSIRAHDQFIKQNT